MNLSAKAQVYVGGVCVAGLCLLLYSIRSLLIHPVDSGWLILAALTLLSGSFTINVPSLRARISVSETFVFASVLLFGTPSGTIIVALDTLIASLRARNPRQPIRILFNLSAPAISIWVASNAFYALARVPPMHESPTRLPEILIPLVVLTVLYFLANSWFVAIALSFERGASAFEIWRKNFLWLSLNYFGGASVAALLVSYTQTVDLTALGIILPLLLISYLTSKTSLGRIAEANRHVEIVEQLYLSAIETLATAIDAKDQVTHGHIRRVQKFALGLAAELGIKDERQFKAIEAAALLHDTGKLVVPEHILNKPGKLTSGEFEKMKRHASAGAEILSSIRFPFPVVPIVRHHHENWDGTGYPDSLRGTQIPIGARILAVVDCFDALTSDRPYRRKLTDDEAMTILFQRRGSMYDPLVVDVFAAVKDKLSESLLASESQLESLLQAPRHKVSDSVDELITATVTPNQALAKLTNAVLLSVLDRTGARLAIFFVRDPRRDELQSFLARSSDGPVALRIVMPVGSRVSGWVAANGRSIINADAVLDIPADAGSFGLSRCMCVPVTQGVHIHGVLALYVEAAKGFTEQDLVAAEAAVRAVDLTPLAEFIESIASQTPRHASRVH